LLFAPHPRGAGSADHPFETGATAALRFRSWVACGAVAEGARLGHSVCRPPTALLASFAHACHAESLAHTFAHPQPPHPPPCALPGPRGADRNRVADNASYKLKKFGESSDNPLYRLPEQPQGGHRVDGLTPWSAKAAAYTHH
jgi:hypothetical protein